MAYFFNWFFAINENEYHYLDNSRSELNVSFPSYGAYFDDDKRIAYLPSNDGILECSYDDLYTIIRNQQTIEFAIDYVSFRDTVLYAGFDKLIYTSARQMEVSLAYFDWLGYNIDFLRYRLDNNDYVEVSSSILSFDNFSPGYHTLQIQVSASGYVWSDVKTIQFYVSYRWYEKFWFKAIVVVFSFLSITLLVYLIIRYNNRKANRKLEFERKMNDLKLQALNAAINSHFLYNVLNAIQFFVSSGQNDKASRFIADFARFIRIIVDTS